jgi:hypothetical protein
LLLWPVFSLAIVIVIGVMLRWLLASFNVTEWSLGSSSFLLFLALLPLLNAFWDWASLGVTRGLLSAIRLARHSASLALVWSLLDFVLAMVFLLAIIVTLAAGLGFANHLSATGGTGLLADLSTLFVDLRARPADPSLYWVYFMLLSTLFPTLIHLIIAAAAVVLWLGQWRPLKRWREKAADSLKTNPQSLYGAHIYLTFVPMAGLLAPVGLLWLLYWMVTTHGGLIGTGLIDLAETTVRWSGGFPLTSVVNP